MDSEAADASSTAPGPARRPDRRRARTRGAIMAAARALFAERGLQRTTIDEIAQAADVSVGAVYFHFQSKEGLYLALVDQALEVNTEAMASVDRSLPPLDRVLAAGHAYMRFALEYPEHFRMVALRVLDSVADPALADIEDRVAARVEALVGIVEQDLVEAMADGSVQEVPPREVMRFLWGAWNGVTALGFRPDRLRLTPDEVQLTLEVGQGILESALRRR
ncbi:TetR/AcrR family transcriptional regulator [Prescottella agglutinans]|uniref:TetR/AcrR family transcriptional regulator n=1 Tax=Prescottella agglutinans TaxID=1644129 RepID=A0ABT6MBV4_9NOCA|nr:TetR/AcrR family transcriptional regulator [Prescottella agglutinans]MDH6281790.1 TetR/AcrR family transcriptional regulator [Prescottella agglutinans]